MRYINWWLTLTLLLRTRLRQQPNERVWEMCRWLTAHPLHLQRSFRRICRSVRVHGGRHGWRGVRTQLDCRGVCQAAKRNNDWAGAFLSLSTLISPHLSPPFGFRAECRLAEGPFTATQLNSTRRRVELRRRGAIDPSPTQLDVELSWVASL